MSVIASAMTTASISKSSSSEKVNPHLRLLGLHRHAVFVWARAGFISFIITAWCVAMKGPVPRLYL